MTDSGFNNQSTVNIGLVAMHVGHILMLIIFALVHLIRNSEKIIIFKISKDGSSCYVAVTSI